VRWAQQQLNLQDKIEIDNKITETVHVCEKFNNPLHVNNENDFKNEDTVNIQHDSNKEDNVNNKKRDCKVIDGASERRKILDSVVPHIRILSVTPQEFLQATEEEDIFSSEEIFQILRCIATPSKYKIPAGLCEITSARICAVGSFTEVTKEDQDMMDTMKPELDQKEMEEVNFNIYNSFNYIKSSESRIRVDKTVVIYGFQFHACGYNQDHKGIIPLALNVHYENFTLHVYQSGKCVARYNFAGRLKYDSKTNLYFRKPFLARENSQIPIKLEFNQDLERKYQNYYHSRSTKLNDVFAIETTCHFSCLSQILYKVI
jgi:hypothetical protein